jgi:hypothetical protein
VIGRVLRVLFGYILACLAAGLTMVLFVYTPMEMVTLPSEVASDRASEAGLLTLAAATHTAVFSAPFALIGVAIGEWRHIGSWTYYVLVGIVIAVIGFFTQYSSEAGGETSIINNYAISAFLVTGLIAGFVYWLFSGRFASWDAFDEYMLDEDDERPVRPSPAPSVPAAKPAPPKA